MAGRGERDPGVQLLADARVVFRRSKLPAAMPSERLVKGLRLLQDGGLAEEAQFEGEVTATVVSNLLRAFGVRPKMIRFGAKTQRGYRLTWFEPVWARHLDP